VHRLADGFHDVTEDLWHLELISRYAMHDQGLRFAVFARRGE